MDQSKNQPGSAAPAGDATVFLSYARADDEKPPFDDAAVGWVSFFWGQLRFELTDRGAKRATLWRDRYEIDPADAFTEVIEQAVKGARVIVPVFSKNWVQSEWCRREVETFAAVHAAQATERIVPVYKNQPDRDALPPLMQGDAAREGFQFFTRDASGQVSEFYWRGLRDRTAYFDLLRRVAESIIHRLGEAGESAAPAPSQRSLGRTVFLAFAANDLADARQRLKNDLGNAGFTVVPAGDTPPDTAEELEAIIGAALGQAECAVHFLGEKQGFTPEGGQEALLKMQLRLARGSKLVQILWAPRWLPGSSAADKRDPFAVIAGFGGRRQGEEVFGEEVTDLSQWLRKRLEPAPAPAPAAQPEAALIVASAHADDDEHAVELANLAQGHGPRIRSWLADAAGSPGDGSTVLIPWGSAPPAALDALLARLAAGSQRICLRLPGGDEAAKKRFFREGVLVERLAALPADRPEARALLERLNLVKPAAGSNP
jgi:hypothetical protein